MTWTEFIGYLMRPNGIAVAVGLVWSVALEYIPQFDKLQPKWKRLVFCAICLAVPLAASLAGVASGAYELSFDGLVWPALVAGFTTFASGTLLHARKLPDSPGSAG